jgi:hypothetical protein
VPRAERVTKYDCHNGDENHFLADGTLQVPWFDLAQTHVGPLLTGPVISPEDRVDLMSEPPKHDERDSSNENDHIRAPARPLRET